MAELHKKNCVPCSKTTTKLTASESSELLSQLNGWEMNENEELAKSWRFKDFASALAFVNEIGRLSEQENHHPEITFTWGKVAVSISTHSVGGLTENDFILAAKIDSELNM